MAKLPKADLKAERDGVWLTYHGIRFRIGRRGTKDYLERQAELMGPLQHQALRGVVDNEQAQEIDAQLLGEFCVLGWEDLEDEVTGEPLEFSPEKAIELLLDPENHPWRRWVEMQCGRDDLYRKQTLEIAKGN